MAIATGDKFGRWTVAGYAGTINGLPSWHCQCECGTRRAVWAQSLRRGQSQSCGCLHRERLLARITTHNSIETPEYSSWKDMKARCLNPNNPAFGYYGGRGISICDRWLHSFSAFLEDLGRRPSLKHTLERRDTNGNYTPDNCYWATRKQQQNNLRSNVRVLYGGELRTISQWAEHTGVPREVIYWRINHGWPVARAIFTPRMENYVRKVS